MKEISLKKCFSLFYKAVKYTAYCYCKKKGQKRELCLCVKKLLFDKKRLRQEPLDSWCSKKDIVLKGVNDKASARLLAKQLSDYMGDMTSFSGEIKEVTNCKLSMKWAKNELVLYCSIEDIFLAGGYGLRD